MADEKKFTYDKFSYDSFSHPDYTEGETVTAAKTALDTQLAQKPGAYQSQWQMQLNDVMDKIMNREKFSYDVNGDALYQQYKDKYIQQGKMAMADTMGQAAAMTGGYGNSYAASVGNQAYQASLQNLNDVIPELYQMAYDRYNQEEQSLYNRYGLLTDRENTDYSRYRDTVSDFNTERDYLTGRYDSERSYDYSKYTDDRNFNYGKYSDDKSYAYNDYRNAITDAQWQANFDEAQRQYNESAALAKEQWEVEKAKAGASVDKSTGTVNITKTPSYLTDPSDIQEWSDALLSAGTEADANIYAERLFQVDPDLANRLLLQWENEHKKDDRTTDTTVPVITPPRSFGGGLASQFVIPTKK